MEFKGKVSSVSKGWESMYPNMHDGGASSKARVEIELDGSKSSRVCIELPQKDAAQFRFGQEVTVSVTPKASGK